MISSSPLAAIGHVGLNVTDLDRSIVFFTDVLGLEVAGESREDGRRYAFLGAGDAVMLTLWEQSRGRFSTATPGLHHLAFRVADADAVEEVHRRLRAHGATIHHDGIVAHREGADSGGIFFEDPDGTRIEIFATTGMRGRTAPHREAPTCGFF